MGKRRTGRVLALQLLFSLDTLEAFDSVDDAIARHFDSIEPQASDEAREFGEALCRGVVSQRHDIDRLLQLASDNWRLERMSYVDRNVLRLAAYELRCRPEIPPRVVINEAIEIGKAFGTNESGGFINGVLDRVLREIEKA